MFLVIFGCSTLLNTVHKCSNQTSTSDSEEEIEYTLCILGTENMELTE